MAKVKLHRVANNTGEAEISSTLHVPGMTHPIRFDKNGFAMVDEADWTDWISQHAAAQGVYLVPAATRKN